MREKGMEEEVQESHKEFFDNFFDFYKFLKGLSERETVNLVVDGKYFDMKVLST